MSMILTRSPLEPIGMNGAGVNVPKRRSARLSGESVEENEPPAKKNRTEVQAQTSTMSTKEADGDLNAVGKKKRKVYDDGNDDFAFAKRKRASKDTKTNGVRNSGAEKTSPMKPPPSVPAPAADPAPPAEEPAPKTARKKNLKRLPTTPEREAADRPVRRSKRLSDENENDGKQVSPHKAAHAKSHQNQNHGSPSPFKARPVTVEKKRRKGQDGVEEEKIMRIQLPFADTPVIKRNKEMRKASAENAHRRSSSGMRGRRASSLIDEGRGNALPHSEVPSSEFYKHISAELTEPRRMRCLLGWCGQRALPSKPEPPKETTPAANFEFQAQQAARVVIEELALDFVTKGSLSDWFSRDDSAPPQMPLRKKPNPRNVANSSKAEELERELERLKKERAEWDSLIKTAAPAPSSPAKPTPSEDEGSFSPIRAELLDSPQRAILEQLQAPTTEFSTDPTIIQQRLRNITENLEFTVDQFAHGVHALSATRELGEQLADQALSEAASALEEREKMQRLHGKAVDPMDALKGLAKILNSRNR